MSTVSSLSPDGIRASIESNELLRSNQGSNGEVENRTNNAATQTIEKAAAVKGERLALASRISAVIGGAASIIPLLGLIVLAFGGSVHLTVGLDALIGISGAGIIIAAILLAYRHQVMKNAGLEPNSGTNLATAIGCFFLPHLVTLVLAFTVL